MHTLEQSGTMLQVPNQILVALGSFMLIAAGCNTGENSMPSPNDSPTPPNTEQVRNAPASTITVILSTLR